MRRKNVKTRQADNAYADIVLTDKDAKSYNKIDCLEELYSADQILDRVRVDRSSLFKNIRKMKPDDSVDMFENVFSIDEKCMCQGGWGPRPYVNKQYCSGCEIARRISKGIQIPEDGLIKIEEGNYLSHSYTIVNCENILTYYERTKEYESLSVRMIDKMYSMHLHDDIFRNINDRTFYYSTISPISNYITICIILQNKMHKYKFPTVPLFEWAYQCGKNTYLLEAFPTLGFGSFENIIDIGDFVKGPKSPTARRSHSMTMNHTILISILRQLVSTLHFLAKYSFIHGNPNIRHIAFSKKPCYYKYEDIEISAPLTFHLIPSNDSSITVENDNGEYFRFLNSGYSKYSKEYDYIVEKVEPLLVKKGKEMDMRSKDLIPVLPELQSKIVYGYKIGICRNNFRELITQKGIPLAHTSFDLYMFMFSLLCEESFFASFQEHQGLMALWKDMFKFSEYEAMMNDLKTLRMQESDEPATFQEILDVMSKYTFRNDALSFFWESLKTVE